MLALVLLAALCPLAVTAAVAPPAAQPGTIEQLPDGFIAFRINNSGQMVGTVSEQGRTVGLGILTDGVMNVGPLVNGPIIDFNDAGQALLRNADDRQLYLFDSAGTRALPKPVVDGVERDVLRFGPDENGRVIATLAGEEGSTTNAVIYQGPRRLNRSRN
ncbi:MAG: hypothetical protein R2704_10070 [Microthrixaceae bacterium]